MAKILWVLTGMLFLSIHEMYASFINPLFRDNLCPSEFQKLHVQSTLESSDLKALQTAKYRDQPARYRSLFLSLLFASVTCRLSSQSTPSVRLIFVSTHSAPRFRSTYT